MFSTDAGDLLRSARTVLLAKTGSTISDLLAVTPLIRNLRQALPNIRLLFLTRQECLPAVEDHPDLDGVFPVSFRGTLAGIRGHRTVKRLREEAIDVVLLLDIQGASPESIRWIRRCRPAVVVGWENQDRDVDSRFQCDHLVPEPEDSKIHIVDYNLAFLEQLGIPIVDRRHVVGVTDAQKAGARENLERIGIDLARPIFGSHVGGVPNHPERQWSPSNYATLLQRAHKEHGFQPVILGDTDDQPTVDQILALGKTPIPTLLNLSYPEYKGVLSQLSFFLTHDGEPTQIAAGVGVPSFFVFLSIPAWRWAPYGSHIGIWEDSGKGPSASEIWGRIQAPLVETAEHLGPGVTRT